MLRVIFVVVVFAIVTLVLIPVQWKAILLFTRGLMFQIGIMSELPIVSPTLCLSCITLIGFMESIRPRPQSGRL